MCDKTATISFNPILHIKTCRKIAGEPSFKLYINDVIILKIRYFQFDKPCNIIHIFLIGTVFNGILLIKKSMKSLKTRVISNFRGLSTSKNETLVSFIYFWAVLVGKCECTATISHACRGVE